MMEKTVKYHTYVCRGCEAIPKCGYACTWNVPHHCVNPAGQSVTFGTDCWVEVVCCLLFLHKGPLKIELKEEE